MLTVTKDAALFLKVAKAAEGASLEAGIRIVRGAMSDESEKPEVGFTVSNDPEPEDEEIEQEGLRIFVQDVLVEPLDGHTLDLGYVGDEPKLMLR